MTRRHRVGSRPGRLLLTALLLTACGVEPQSEPQPVPRDRLPSASPSTSGPAAPARARVWGIRDQRLVPVFVAVSGDDLVPRVQALLTLADSEQATTSIPRGTRLVAVRRDGENVELELNSVFVATPTREVPLALAQLVFTLTEVPGVQRARIEVDGSAVPLVDANGQVLGRPLQRSDFAALSGRSAD